MTFIPKRRGPEKEACEGVINTRGMLELVAEKGRRFGEEVARRQLRAGWVESHVLRDPHFNACLASFLGKLVARHELAPDLKNIGKATFEAIEDVVLARLDRLCRMEALIKSTEAREQSIAGLLEGRLQALKGRISI